MEGDSQVSQCHMMKRYKVNLFFFSTKNNGQRIQALPVHSHGAAGGTQSLMNRCSLCV